MELETFEPLKCACCFLLLFLPDAHDRVMRGLLVSCWDDVQHTGSNVALNLWHASFPLLNLSLGRFSTEMSHKYLKTSANITYYRN